jgi:hypothetical protein
VITHEINKPTPVLPVVLRNSINEAVNRARAPMMERDSYWGKLEYAHWIEEEVKKKWKRGDYATIRGVVEIEGSIPAPLFQVDQIQEIHFMAPVSDVAKEPRCMMMRNAQGSIPISYCPSMLRPLSEKELELVRLRDQSSPKRTIKIVGQTLCEVDDETGEIIKQYADRL